MKQSNALWPDGVCSSMYGDNISTDTHQTEEQAQAVCDALFRDGFGGQGERFPIRTWVSDVQDPPVLPDLVKQVANLSDNDLSCLSHMLAAKSEKKGYRNHFAAGKKGHDAESMEALRKVGLVSKGAQTKDLTFYHATELGCKVAGLNEVETKRALED